jgi:hypothetical protein
MLRKKTLIFWGREKLFQNSPLKIRGARGVMKGSPPDFKSELVKN